MRYFLTRDRDGAGDSGPMSQALIRSDDGGIKDVGPVPVVGAFIRVGSPYSRTYSQYDYWTTTQVTEIYSDETVEGVRTIRFKTGNSEYTWEAE